MLCFCLLSYTQSSFLIEKKETEESNLNRTEAAFTTVGFSILNMTANKKVKKLDVELRIEFEETFVIDKGDGGEIYRETNAQSISSRFNKMIDR